MIYLVTLKAPTTSAGSIIPAILTPDTVLWHCVDSRFIQRRLGLYVETPTSVLGDNICNETRETKLKIKLTTGRVSQKKA